MHEQTDLQMDLKADEFFQAFRGRFPGITSWLKLDEFWQVLKSNADDHWYVYAIGEAPPEVPFRKEQLLKFIDEINTLLHKEHDKDYCGIVYVDDLSDPKFVKIYDPNNLGVSCGFSDNPPLPGWTITRLKPVSLPDAMTHTGERKRWWQKLFG